MENSEIFEEQLGNEEVKIDVAIEEKQEEEVEEVEEPAPKKKTKRAMTPEHKARLIENLISTLMEVET